MSMHVFSEAFQGDIFIWKFISMHAPLLEGKEYLYTIVIL